MATPFLNVRPEVRYVGDEACASCHRNLTNSYRQHPMGRSLEPTAAASALEHYEADARNPFEAHGFLYRVDRRGERVFHHQTVVAGGVQADAEIAFAVGSGRRGENRCHFWENRCGRIGVTSVFSLPAKPKTEVTPIFSRFSPDFLSLPAKPKTEVTPIFC